MFGTLWGMYSAMLMMSVDFCYIVKFTFYMSQILSVLFYSFPRYSMLIVVGAHIGGIIM